MEGGNNEVVDVSGVLRRLDPLSLTFCTAATDLIRQRTLESG